MARVTVEDCIEKVGNRFARVILAGRRARLLSRGAEPLVESDNRPAVTALREIAAEPTVQWPVGALAAWGVRAARRWGATGDPP